MGWHNQNHRNLVWKDREPRVRRVRGVDCDHRRLIAAIVSFFVKKMVIVWFEIKTRWGHRGKGVTCEMRMTYMNFRYEQSRLAPETILPFFVLALFTFIRRCTQFRHHLKQFNVKLPETSYKSERRE